MDKKTDVRDPDEKVVEIEMERLRAFPNHPFKVIGDSQMIELQDSIKKYGVLNSLIVRPKIEGYYEIISGHRRKYAAEKLGYKKIPVIIRMLQDDEPVEQSIWIIEAYIIILKTAVLWQIVRQLWKLKMI